MFSMFRINVYQTVFYIQILESYFISAIFVIVGEIIPLTMLINQSDVEFSQFLEMIISSLVNEILNINF